MSPEKLVMMANQIGRFFAAQTSAEAATSVADHIRKFWEPRMRQQMYAHLETGGAGLDPAVRAAFEALRARDSVAAGH